MAAPKSTEFSPNFVITPAIANALMRIEAAKQSIQALPITPRVLANWAQKPIAVKDLRSKSQQT
jgi:hypothetical protein